MMHQQVTVTKAKNGYALRAMMDEKGNEKMMVAKDMTEMMGMMSEMFGGEKEMKEGHKTENFAKVKEKANHLAMKNK